MPHATVLRQMPPDTRRAGVGGWEELGGRRRRCCGGRRRRLAGYSTGRVRSTQQYRYTDSTGVVTWAGCARPPPAQRTHISFIALLNSSRYSASAQRTFTKIPWTGAKWLVQLNPTHTHTSFGGFMDRASLVKRALFTWRVPVRAGTLHPATSSTPSHEHSTSIA